MLLLGGMVDGVIVLALSVPAFELMSGAWAAWTATPVEPPVIGFMSDYGRPAQNGYWLWVALSPLVAAVVTTLAVPLLGASPGKRLLGIRYAGPGGERAPLGRALAKLAVNVGLFLLAALPGPLLGFALGDVADAFSLLALFAAVALVLWLSLRPGPDGRTFAYRATGLWPLTAKEASHAAR